MYNRGGKSTYSEYGFSSIGSWLYSTTGEGFKIKLVLHSFREIKCNQAYFPGIFHKLYKILGLPILMTVSSLAVSFENYNRGSQGLISTFY